jgi:hypothetical protein
LPLNKLDNFIKNVEGRILYVNPNDLDATDSIENTGNSLAKPFKTIQRALLESARFSFVSGDYNDLVEKTTILLFPGEHVVDNRPGYAIYNNGGTAYAVPPSGGVGSPAINVLSLKLDSNYDLTEEDNLLYKFNSVNGGVIVPRGTSIVGLDLRKTKIRPKYVPNPTDSSVDPSAIFRITGACYFWQFSIFDADPSGTVYTDSQDFTSTYKSTPTFSHHKLTCFEYADGVNNVGSYGLTDLDMYYSKLSNAFISYRTIEPSDRFPANPAAFAKKDPEWQIVGAFASDPISISSIVSGDGATSTNIITVTTNNVHNLNVGTPIKIKGSAEAVYNTSTTVQSITSSTTFTYLLPTIPVDPTPSLTGATVTVETDTVSGASPYIFNCSLRTVWGMNGMLADGSKASGFRSMVVAQFTAVSLQKDDRAFVKYNTSSRIYEGVALSTVHGAALTSGASQTDTTKVYHLDPRAIYRQGWETSHIKATNDSFIQIVSVFAIGFNKHFDVESGGDASITNSNSNFGQISLNSEGFKVDAFSKDDNAFITSIIAPRSINLVEEDIEWISINVGITTLASAGAGTTTKLYLYGYNAEDTLPTSVVQGYRIGARQNDKLYVKINGTEYFANIYMEDGATSSSKNYTVTSIGTTTLTIGSNTLETGEKIIINSETGDLPEGITPHIPYYSIKTDSTKINLATSYTNALNAEYVTFSGGSQLKVYSRVSDKDSGELGSPIQWDSNGWYINVNSGNSIYTQLNTLGVAGIGSATDSSYVKRIVDDRSLDEKLYKFRVSVPRQLSAARDPQVNFVIQESSSTGARTNSDFSLSSLTVSDYGYNKNSRYITTCTESSGTVTVLTDLPHNLNVGDVVNILNVKDSTNTTGASNIGYNGRFTVNSVVNDMSFTYSTTDVNGVQHTLGSSSNNNTYSTRTITELPRFERNDLQSNLYVYRSEVISPYIEGEKDGISHLYVLNASNAVTEEFTNLKYSQSSVNLYPQLDRDNIDANPPAAKTFALRSPLGDVNTNDLKRSITRETADKTLTTLGIGLTISSFSSNNITFARNHGLSGIVTGTITAGSGYTNGTYYNVKLLGNSANPTVGTWKGATAKVIVSGGAVTSVNIISSGSGYSDASLYFDQTIIGSGNGAARYTIVSAGISTSIGDVVQVTGIGTTSDGYFRITSVGSENQISIGKTVGDPSPISGQYVFVTGPSSKITASPYVSASGITTFTTETAHGLLKGNQFRIIDSSNNNLGDYIVEEKVGIKTFTAITNQSLSATNGYVLKHGLSANQAISDIREENLGTRQICFYNNEFATLSNTITNDSSSNQLQVSASSGIGTAARFPLGSYVQIDNEIMRIISSNSDSQFTVIRGSFGTRKEIHETGSLIRKIKAPAIEFHRPSVVRASGHTFEYLGYGPGNYSTALPQVQVKNLTEREEFLVQAQERSAGIVVYTGMNNNGDFFSGNTKTSAASGEIKSYDIPVATVTGENPSSSSGVFDELTIRERIVVEGGDSGNVVSQFDGPVTFNNETRFKETTTFNGDVKIKSNTESSSSTTGALVVTGGVGIGEDLYIAGEFNANGNITLGNNSSDTLTVNATSEFNSDVDIDANFAVRTSAGVDKFTVASASGNTGISGTLDVTGQTTLTGLLDANGGASIDNIQIGITGNNEIDTSSGNLTIDSAGGLTIIDDNLSVTGVSTFDGTITGTISTATNATNATNANNINISATTSSDTSTSVVLVADQATGNQSPFIDSGLTYNANTNALSATTFVGNLQGNADTATSAGSATSANSAASITNGNQIYWGISLWGVVAGDGSSLNSGSGGWSSTRTDDPGKYKVTFTSARPNANYLVIVTAVDGSGSNEFAVLKTKLTTEFTVHIRDDSGNLRNSQFSFIMIDN